VNQSVSYVYIIAEGKEGPCKIGYSRAPERRLKQLQTGHASPLHIFHKEEIASDEVRGLEKVVHDVLRYRQIRGEWYDLPVEEATSEVSFARMTVEDNVREETAHQRIRRLYG
jgi:hypothetical protein